MDLFASGVDRQLICRVDLFAREFDDLFEWYFVSENRMPTLNTMNLPSVGQGEENIYDSVYSAKQPGAPPGMVRPLLSRFKGTVPLDKKFLETFSSV